MYKIFVEDSNGKRVFEDEANFAKIIIANNEHVIDKGFQDFENSKVDSVGTIIAVQSLMCKSAGNISDMLIDVCTQVTMEEEKQNCNEDIKSNEE